MNRKDFARQVREALVHLHNRAYLESLPLATLLGATGRPLTGDALRRQIIETIEQLKPAQSTPSTLADWRRYRHLVLRYIEGYSRDQVARELMVSARQASRDHERAIDALAAALWHRRFGPQSYSPVLQPAHSLGVAVEPTSAVRWRDDEAAPELGEVETDLAATVSGVLATLQKLLANRQVRIDLALPGILPPVAVNRVILRQALLHLLSYAAEVCTGKSVRLTAADTRSGVTLQIELLDGDKRSGTSRRLADPTADIKDLFEVGANLLASQGIAIALEGTVDQPRRLSLTLPPVSQPTILIVDDNPDLIGLFRRYLRGEPYRLIQATSGTSALRIARNYRPAVIILDVMIPSLDGWDILNELRSTPELSDTTVIVCSVLPEQALARELGVADFLPKPVTQPALLATLHRWCPVTGAYPARP